VDVNSFEEVLGDMNGDATHEFDFLAHHNCGPYQHQLIDEKDNPQTIWPIQTS
jgi:hypothetical protein